MLPVIKLIKGPVSGSFYQISGSEIQKQVSGTSRETLFTLPEGKKWSHVAAVSEDETRFAACDTEKNLYCFALDADKSTFELSSVAMHLAKTATGLCFTGFPSKNSLLVADKFGDVLRFEDGQDFDRWARQSLVNSKVLSIHTHKKRPLPQEDEEAQEEKDTNDVEETTDSNEAHHCTIIGHISMITDVAVLPVSGMEGGLIVTCDRDEKVRFSKAASPERIHSFGLAHRLYVASLAACEATCSVFSAGGDNFICEWRIEGNNCVLANRIELPRGDVQEVKVSKCGKRLVAWFLGDQICEFEPSQEGTWSAKSSIEAKNATAICLTEGEVEVCRCEDAVAFEEAAAQISKSKLRKDIERMDWKLKRHEKKEE